MGGGDLMAASGDGPSFREMREALERFVQKDGLRAFSREVRMSASAVDRLVKGGARPSESTVRKLRQWFLRPASE